MAIFTHTFAAFLGHRAKTGLASPDTRGEVICMHAAGNEGLLPIHDLVDSVSLGRLKMVKAYVLLSAVVFWKFQLHEAHLSTQVTLCTT